MLSSSEKRWLGGGAIGCLLLGVWLWHLPVSQPESPPPAMAPPGERTPAPPEPVGEKIGHAPMTQAELPTTDGEISIGNIIGAVSSAEAWVARRPKDPIAHAQLVGVLLLRGQILGHIADFERAAAIAEQSIKVAPSDPRSFMARAQTRGVFHAFQAALADLDQAEKLSRQAHEEALLPSLTERRVALLRGLGRLDEAAALMATVRREDSDIGLRTAEASLVAEQGDSGRAEALFVEAQRHHPDVTPFPVAFLYLQHGLLWEARGNLARAHELYSAAHERLPAYAAVRSHLASIEAARAQRERAIELLQPLAANSDDPEYAGQLSLLLKEAGLVDEAERLHSFAEKRYEALLASHPTAYAAHAARFYLGAGGNAQAAAKWAEKNLAARVTPEAYSLAVEATAAAAMGDRACALADAMGKMQVVTPQMHVMAARAYQACGKPQRAEAELGKIARP